MEEEQLKQLYEREGSVQLKKCEITGMSGEVVESETVRKQMQ